MTATASVRRDRAEGGYIVYTVLVFVILIAALSVGLRGALQAAVRDRPRERSAVAAVYAAQGGIEKARAALARDPSWAGGTVAVGRGSAEVAVREVSGEPSLRTVVSIGSVPGPGAGNVAAKRRVEVRLRLGEGLPSILSWRED
jgi:hypothetical protein